MAKQYVMTDYTGCRYVTAGKVYELAFDENNDELVVDDEGDKIIIASPVYHASCFHLEGIGRWYYVGAEGNKL
jgi:hypothetical protein